MMDSVDQVRLSYYDGNADSFSQLQNRYPDKVSVVDRRVLVEPPTQLLPSAEVMPAECNNAGWMVSMGWAYACGCLPAAMLECSLDASDYPDLWCRVEPGYLEKLLPYVPACYDPCRGCLANLKVRDRLKV